MAKFHHYFEWRNFTQNSIKNQPISALHSDLLYRWFKVFSTRWSTLNLHNLKIKTRNVRNSSFFQVADFHWKFTENSFKNQPITTFHSQFIHKCIKVCWTRWSTRNLHKLKTKTRNGRKFEFGCHDEIHKKIQLKINQSSHFIQIHSTSKPECAQHAGRLELCILWNQSHPNSRKTPKRNETRTVAMATVTFTAKIKSHLDGRGDSHLSAMVHAQFA